MSLKLDLNSDKVKAILIVVGRFFHSVGPATSKALLPLVFKRVLGIWRRNLFPDLSPHVGV